MSSTPLLSIPVQERSRKRLCFDISPSSNSEFDRDVNLLLSDEALPKHLRTVIATLLEDRKLLETVLNRNRELTEEVNLLRKENLELKNSLSSSKLIPQNVAACSSVNESRSVSPVPPPVDDPDAERKRCVVVVGMRESASPIPSRRVVDDINSACHFMDFLGVECSPVSVFRMGRFNHSYPRLVKIVLPTSFHANLMLRRASRLKHYTTQKIFIRPSLPKAERDRLRAERVARRKNMNRDNILESTPPLINTSAQNNPPGPIVNVQPNGSGSSRSQRSMEMSN